MSPHTRKMGEGKPWGHTQQGNWERRGPKSPVPAEEARRTEALRTHLWVAAASWTESPAQPPSHHIHTPGSSHKLSV